MYKITLFILAAVFAVALAEGQYYVPRAYYTIDAEGHESARVPLRRLRRALHPYPYYASGGASSNADAKAEAFGGGSASAIANAHASASGDGWGGRGGRGGGGYNDGGYNGGSGEWNVPAGFGAPSIGQTWNEPVGKHGATRLLSVGMTRRQLGPVEGRSVIASTSVGLDASGAGYYDQSASVH